MKRLNKKDWLFLFKEQLETGELKPTKLVRDRMSKIDDLKYEYGLKEALQVVREWKNYPKIIWEFVERGFYLDDARIEMHWYSPYTDYKSWETIEHRETLKETRKHAKELIAYYNSTIDTQGGTKRIYRGLRFRASRNDEPDLVIKL